MWDLIFQIAKVDLGLSMDEFKALNHRQFTLLHHRVLRLRWQHEMTIAMNTYATWTCGMVKLDPPPTPEQFVLTQLPGLKRAAPVRRKPRMTKKRREEITGELRNMFQALGKVTCPASIST